MSDVDFDKLIDNHLIRESKPKEIGRYYPSEVGGCLRKTWFSYKLPKEIDAKLLRIFESGNLLHEFISNVIKSEKNPEVELLKHEMPIKIKQDDFLISGRIDNLVLLKISGKKFLVEVKSTKFLRDEAQEAHILQLQFYMHATKIHNGIVLYIQKDDLKTKWFDIKYDEKKALGVINRFKNLHSCLKNNKIPRAEAKLKEDIRWMCNYCDYRIECDEINSF